METYIKNCVLCQQNKSAKHARYGQIKFAPVPTLPWYDVTMDFVVKLPKSKNPTTQEIYDSIMVMVDKLTKYALMIPFKKNYKTDQFGFILLDRLVKNHGIPATITSDKNKLFTSNYWKTLMSAIGTKLKMSTIYHPETDGQTKKINQSMETYFRHYVNVKQNNWVSFLPITQLAHNNKKSDTTGLTPFFANYGKHPELFHAPKPGPNAHRTMVTVSDMTKLHEKMADAIIQNNKKTETRMNSKRKMAPQLKEGDKLYFLIKNFKTKKPSKKLDHVKVGPFLIKKIKRPFDYELDLPADAKIFPMFNIFLLEPASPDTPLATTFRYHTEKKNEYEIEKILRQNGQRYFIRWKNCNETENTWEPIKNFGNCQTLLRQFHQTGRTNLPSQQEKQIVRTRHQSKK